VTAPWAELDEALRRLEPPEGGAALSPLERARTGAKLAPDLAALAADPLDPALLEALPALHPRITEAIARNPHLPVSWQLPLAGTQEGLTHTALVARRDLLPVTRLALLASPEAQVRARVLELGDPAVAAAALRHPDPWLRASAATNSTSPAELAILGGDADARVRRRVAENPASPQRILMRLGRDDDSGVRKAARAHPNWAPAWWERWWSP
jgi:hypothetical protein